jgi:hypothetical protein
MRVCGGGGGERRGGTNQAPETRPGGAAQCTRVRLAAHGPAHVDACDAPGTCTTGASLTLTTVMYMTRTSVVGTPAPAVNSSVTRNVTTSLSLLALFQFGSPR